MGEVYSSALKDVYGESVSLTTTAAHVLFRPNYHEVLVFCASDWRWGLAPKLSKVVYYSAAGGTYTDYTTEATDRVSTTHVPLDAMAAADYLYLRTENPVRGFYFNPVSNLNSEAADLDWEYLYDVADTTYQKITGTVSGAFTVGETVTGGTSGATGTLVYGPAGSTYITVKSVSGAAFAVGETATGVTSTETCSAITAVAGETYGTGFFTDVASDNDGTKAVQTMDTPGLYSFTLPSVIWGELPNIGGGGYWYRFAPSIALSATVDLVDIIPACPHTNYGYGFGGIAKQFSINTRLCGAFEFDHASTDTLYVDWIRR